MKSKKYVDFDKVITTYKTFGHLNLHNALEAFNEIPAADVRPVVRGFWVEENGEDSHTGELWCIWKCSECGVRRTAGWRHTQDGRKPRDNFCPNCGADMREIINE